MNASNLQYPAESEVAYREIAGKQNRGYVPNLTEGYGENGSIITDYQYDQYIYGDGWLL